MKPVSYGYLPLRPGDDADRTRRRLVAYAEEEGFAVADIFVERPWPRTAAFAALLDSLDWTGARDVVVPDRLPAGSPMVTALAKRGARLWVLHR